MLTSIQSAIELSPGYQEFVREEAVAEKKKLDAIAASANAERQKIAKAYVNLQKPFWSKPISQVVSKIEAAKGRRDLLSAYYWDVLLRGSEEPEGTQPSDPYAVFKSWVESLPARTGFSLSIEGLLRFQNFVLVQSVVGGNLVNEGNMQLYMQTLVREEVFAANELTYDASLIVKAPEPVRAPSVDDFESLNLSTDEGQRVGRQIADELYCDEMAPLANQWRQSVLQNFGFVVLYDDLKYMCDWFAATNKSYLDPRSYDAFRIMMVKSGRWYPAEKFLAHEEIKAAAIDKLDMSNRDVRSIVFNGSKQALLDLMQRHSASLV